MVIMTVRKPKKKVVRKVRGKVRVRKVRRDTLKNVSNIQVTVPAVVSSSGGGGASSSASTSGGAGFNYPMTAGVADNTTGNELKQLRQDVALSFQNLIGDLANSRELDRQFTEQRFADQVMAQPTSKTVITREAGVQNDIVVPMDNVAATAAVGAPVIQEPLNQGPVEQPPLPVPVAVTPAREPLVQAPMPAAERMEVVGRREAAREGRNRAQRLAAEQQAAAVQEIGLQAAPFQPPAQGLEGRGRAEIVDGVLGNVRLPKRTANPDLQQPRMPRGAGNELVVDPNAAARAAAEQGYIERITNREAFPLYRGLVDRGGVALPLYEGRVVSDRNPKATRFNREGELENGGDQQQQLPQLQYEDDNMNDL
eukprot:2788-Heterococcus_DN1.PRE.5